MLIFKNCGDTGKNWSSASLACRKRRLYWSSPSNENVKTGAPCHVKKQAISVYNSAFDIARSVRNVCGVHYITCRKISVQ